MIAAANSPMNYDNEAYESPPAVADAPAGEAHTLSTEEFDETPVIPKQMSKTTIKDAIIMASRSGRTDQRFNRQLRLLPGAGYIRWVHVDWDPVTPPPQHFLTVATAYVALSVALAQSSVQTYYFTNILGNLFVKSKASPARKAFVDISTMDDIWNFLEVEFMNSLYKSDGPFTVDETAMVYYNNRLLGRPRIRMLKVSTLNFLCPEQICEIAGIRRAPVQRGNCGQ
ncbi:hypothetical protein OSTOST_20474 [Ostertagia ostertagi]